MKDERPSPVPERLFIVPNPLSNLGIKGDIDSLRSIPDHQEGIR